MVGMPGSGKSTFCQNNLSNYYLICGDTYKTQQKMIEQAEKHIKTKSVIFDGTNGTIQKRKLYVDFAKKNHLHVKCIWINRHVEMAYEQIKRRKVDAYFFQKYYLSYTLFYFFLIIITQKNMILLMYY
jgi:predicted kinase